MRFSIRLFLLPTAATSFAGAAEPPPWVTLDPAGHLQYRASARGDRIMDFSSAGYGGGGVPLPDVPTVVTLAPNGGDDTAAIQGAITKVVALPIRNGFHGALELAAGTFRCFAPIRVADGGVVIRGAGSGDSGGTIIELTGKPHRAFEVGGTGRDERADARKLAGQGARIVQAYVPSGATEVEVESTSEFIPGTNVAVVRPITREWVKFMGMADLMRNGKPEHWVSGATLVERQITGVLGHRLQFDLPLTDSIDARYQGREYATVVKYAAGNRIARVGLERFRIYSPPQHLTLGQPSFRAVAFNQVEDAWMRDLRMVDTLDSVSVSPGSRRITVERVDVRHHTAITGAALPADFSLDGSQILIDRCHDQGDRLFYVVTGAQVSGPNVVLNCLFEGGGSIMPHQRWATGLLIDGCRVPGGSIELKNRGEMGSGHGWTIGWAVAWNCTSPTFVVQDPPGAMNWAIGCMGAEKQESMPFDKGRNRPLLPWGEIESAGRPVQPVSLYLAQLAERLGR